MVTKANEKKLDMSKAKGKNDVVTEAKREIVTMTKANRTTPKKKKKREEMTPPPSSRPKMKRKKKEQPEEEAASWD